jgi:protein-S-isoprenylcysteine O-methyltransferase Ste14
MAPAETVFPLNANVPANVGSRNAVPSPTLRVSFWYQWRAVISATSLLTCLALTVLSPARIERGSWADLGFHAAGWLCFFAAIAIRLWATAYLGGRKGRAVVCDGPYSMVRNPLYIGTLCIILSQICFFESLTFACGIVLPLIVYMLGVVPAEEHYLGLKLGEEYREYCAEVPRWWPRFSQFTTPSVVEMNVNGMLQECLRIKNWIWLPFFADAMMMLRSQPWWPQLFNLP